MVLMFGTQSVTFWYPTSSPQYCTLVRPPNPYLLSHARRLRVTVARPSDGPTDPSRRSCGTYPALERETNKILKDAAQTKT